MPEEATRPQQLLAILESGGQQALTAAIEKSVRGWLVRHGWEYALRSIGFKTYRNWADLPPKSWPVAAVMHNDDYQIENRLCIEGEDNFWDHFESIGLHFSTNSAGQHLISVPGDVPGSLLLHERLSRLQSFEWNSQLVAPDYARIYRSVFEYFGTYPGELGGLHWRDFEKLCASVFTAQGYVTVLGPGSNDGGVDIRLTEHPIYGPQTTVVSVKRYKSTKISLELVASILGIAAAQGADRSIFITSSAFLPSAQKFAATSRSTIPLELADEHRVAAWCRDLRPDPAWLARQAASWDLRTAKIVYDTVRVGMIYAAWAAVVAETPLAARLVPLDAAYARSPADPMTGTETPILALPTADASFTARRVDNTYVADDGRFYAQWDGVPRYFDHAD